MQIALLVKGEVRMPGRDIVVIGASAGGLAAFRTIVAALPSPITPDSAKGMNTSANRRHQAKERQQSVLGSHVIARKIVERHSGTIWLTSQLGEDTTFWFTLGTIEGDLHQLWRSATRTNTE